jgi:hypothetical protein
LGGKAMRSRYVTTPVSVPGSRGGGAAHAVKIKPALNTADSRSDIATFACIEGICVALFIQGSPFEKPGF